MKLKLLFATLVLMLVFIPTSRRDDNCIIVISNQEVVGNCIVTTRQICCPGSKCYQTTTSECY